MKNYVNAFVEIVAFDKTDIIVTSVLASGDGDVVKFDDLFPSSEA